MDPFEIADQVDYILEDLEKEGADKQDLMAIAGRLFSIVCTNCNLTKENFLYLCKNIADKGEWREWKKEAQINE